MAVKNYGIRDQWTNLDKLNNGGVDENISPGEHTISIAVF